MLEKGHFERHDDDDGSMLLLLLLLLSSAVAAHMQDDAAPPPRPWCESDSRYYSPLSSAEIPCGRWYCRVSKLLFRCAVERGARPGLGLCRFGRRGSFTVWMAVVMTSTWRMGRVRRTAVPYCGRLGDADAAAATDAPTGVIGWSSVCWPQVKVVQTGGT